MVGYRDRSRRRRRARFIAAWDGDACRQWPLLWDIVFSLYEIVSALYTKFRQYRIIVMKLFKLNKIKL